MGIEVAHSPENIFLLHRNYALDIITEAGLLSAKPSLVPIKKNHKLMVDEGPLHLDTVQQRHLV